MTPAELGLIVRAVSSLSTMVLDIAEKVGVEKVDVPTLDRLREMARELDELPDLHEASEPEASEPEATE